MAMSTAITKVAGASIGEIRALVRMELEAVVALLAVSRSAELLAVQCCRADADMGEATVVVVAAALLEVLARRYVVGIGVVGKRAAIALRAAALEQPALAYRLLFGVVDAPASRASTDT